MGIRYKHFSHTHKLEIHVIPEGAEVTCSGCNSPAKKTIYICWQCNFFLHEQCFNATRSKKHPSHPLHPLTLVPYPTYPETSFYCNSCKMIGTGFSYSCSDCDFNLHVRCCYLISNTTNSHQPLPVLKPTASVPNPYATANVPTSEWNSSIPRYPTGIIQDSNMAHNVSQFPIPQNPDITSHKAYASENYMNVHTIGQNSSMPQNFIYNYAPSAPYEQPSHLGESGKKKSSDKGIIHFSHPHSLALVKIKHGAKKITCSGCQETFVGKGYACAEKNCGFQLDEACFNLEKAIQHKSHPAHPLTLLSASEYANGMFTCGACFKNATGFTYHCSICQYDLDVKCANMENTVKREDHQHVLKLFYDCPLGKDYIFCCDVCYQVVPRNKWTYYCKECDYGTCVDCVYREVCDESREDPNAYVVKDDYPNADPRTNEYHNVIADIRYYEQRLKEERLLAKISAFGRI